MTRQQIFNKACAGLAAQGFLISAKTKGNLSGNFAYRGSDGKRCAIGHLIDDKTARKWDRKGNNITQIASQYPEEFKSIFGKVSVRFLHRLQYCHDLAGHFGAPVEQEAMKNNLIRFAKRHKLKVPACLTKASKR